MKGLDYSYSAPSIASMQSAGVRFVVRYLSRTPSKNLTAAERDRLRVAGFSIVLVWQEGKTQMFRGNAGGVADATDAQTQADALGMGDAPIYFANDNEADLYNAGQWANTESYLDGTASVIGKARTGAYGGIAFIRHMFDKGKITYGWQTYAWSRGQWDARAQLRQTLNNQPLGGGLVDWDESTKDDFGQWPREVSMSIYSGATWRPINVNFSYGGISPRMVVIHIMAGTLNGTDSWFRNSAARASAHFGTGKDGRLYQWVDTNNRAWHASAANSFAIGVENEGQGGESLTEAQLNHCAEVLAWANRVHKIPLKLAANVNDSGLGWHGMGGAAWGGHTGCPGAPIVAQLPTIVAKAKAMVGQPVKPQSLILRQGASGDAVVYLQQRLNVHGAKLVVDGDFGPATLAAVKAFQTKAFGLGPSVDGIVGPATWAALDKAPVVTPAPAPAPAPAPQPQPAPAPAPVKDTHTTVQLGSTGSDVTTLQIALNNRGANPKLIVDGKFGESTLAAVIAWQKAHNLDPDGIVGPLTWASMGH